jgi:saccharopine dehydrogenase-like NADP-dependent oxidoreductase
MKKIMVLGAGMVGRVIAIDLSREYQVTAIDRDKKSLTALEQYPVQTLQADLADMKNIANLVAEADLVVGSVPGSMGFEVTRAVINAGKNMVDIASYEEDALLLDDLAKKKKVTVVVDCGVAPGISSMLVGHYNQRMKVDWFEILAGGLPVKRSWPFQYKAPFSPIDVFGEYIYPVPIVQNGEIVARPPLSDPELVEMEPIGTLEAFNADGLGTMLKTIDIPNMREKCLRYPGHRELMQMFLETGFFSSEPIDLNGVQVRPIDLTAKLLLESWKLGEDEEEFTILRLTFRGTEKDIRKEIVCRLFDRYDPETGFSSMSRTTGYPCTGVSRLLLEGEFEYHGICPPELIGARPQCFERIFSHLKERNVIVHVEEKEL